MLRCPTDVDRLPTEAVIVLPLRFRGLLDGLLLPLLPLPPMPSRLGLFPSKSPRADRRDDDAERATRGRGGVVLVVVILLVLPPPPPADLVRVRPVAVEVEPRLGEDLADGLGDMDFLLLALLSFPLPPRLDLLELPPPPPPPPPLTGLFPSTSARLLLDTFSLRLLWLAELDRRMGLWLFRLDLGPTLPPLPLPAPPLLLAPVPFLPP